MRHKYSRRGILLLLILSLMAMFGMVAVAFVVLSSQTLKATRSGQRMEKAYHPLQNELDEAAMQVLRGTINPVSKIASHSLLEDIYGAGALTGQCDAEPAGSNPIRYQNVCGGQIVEIYTTIDPEVIKRYIGSVLTVTTSSNPSINGLSTRIVGVNSIYGPYWIDPNPPHNRGHLDHSYIQILAFPNGAIPPAPSAVSPNAFTKFIINGMPFSGTGAGANSFTSRLDLHYAYYNVSGHHNDPAYERFQLTSATGGPFAPTYPVALLPFMPVNTYSNLLTNPTGIPFPQLNEDYDAADYQNMLLATPPIAIQDPFMAGMVNRIIPSMHRPALVNYWYQQLFNDWVLSGIPITPDASRRWWTIFHPVDALQKGYIQSPSGSQPPRWPNAAPTPQEIVGYILDLKRNIIGRPLTDDHPNFDGSNPGSKVSYFDTTQNQKFSWECGDIFPPPYAGSTPPFIQRPHLDVDTDGNGEPDSNWIDIGLPVRSTPDGRHYKPLVAIYCLDMDGRLNLNAHGNLAQANMAIPYATQINAGTNSRFAPDSTANLVQQAPLRRGQGIGSAEINLSPLFTVNPTDYQQLLTGVGVVEGRYGIVDTTPGIAVPGRYGENYLGFNKYFSLPNDYSTSMGDYGNFIDLKGTVAIGLDPRGQPLCQNPLIPPATSLQSILLPDRGVTNSLTNPYFGQQQETNPYAINLSPKVVKGLASPTPLLNDNPFSVSELERILRPFDPDSKLLPARLQQLTTTDLTLSRHLITTESHDVPCQVATKVPDSWRGAVFYPETDLNNPTVPVDVKNWIKTWYPPKSIVDLLTAKYYNDARKATGSTPMLSMTRAINTLANNQYKLFPPELCAGLKMNLNRPFVNWGLTQIQLFTQPTPPLTTIAASFNPDGLNPLIYPATGNPVPATEVPLSQQSKQMHARHLFVLMMLLREAGAIHFNELNITGPNKDKLTIRRIAQWAINAVDFMTPDSAMTPFEYDENPFLANGWRVDGRIGTPAYPSPDDAQPFRGLVWGCKSPDLLLAENVNFHDRRVADTNMDPSNKKRTDSNGAAQPAPADPTLDQPQIPQGSTFIELYCTRNDTSPQAPSDLYTYNNATNRWYLELGKMAPVWNATDYSNKFNGQTIPNNLKRAYPVWRLVIGESNILHPNDNVLDRLRKTPDVNTFTPQTEQIRGGVALPTSLLNDTTRPITIDRIVWFTNVSPVKKADDATSFHADAERIYYYRNGTNVVPGGEYLIVGPRFTTHIGSRSILPGAITATNFWGDPSPQTINLNPVGFINNESNPFYPNTLVSPTPQIKTPQAMIVAADPPTLWADKTQTIGLSISEPIPGVDPTVDPYNKYYTEPTFNFGGVKEWYGMPNDSTTRTFGKPEDSNTNKPLGHEHLLASKTTLNYKTFFLQRLANPSEPFEPTTNPYITVDWQPADLTVFNGMDYMSQADWAAVCASNGFTTAPSWDPDDPTVAKPNDNIRLASRQRGYDTGTVVNNIWLPVSIDPVKSTLDAAAMNLVFPYNLNTTLGYLNLAYWDRTRVSTWNPSWKNWDGATPPPLWRDQSNPALPNTIAATQPWITSVTLDKTTGAVPNPPVPQYYGDPLTPYPWITWNNRPYNSPYELMLVPSDDPGRMLMNWQIPTTPNLYEPNTPAQYPFPSLLDFFVRKCFDPALATLPPAPSPPPPSLYRIFDYLQVPSPFVDAEIQANPILAANDTFNLSTGNQHWFRTPYNRIPNYRETGKINLNTIYDSQVYDGLMNNFPGTWTQFVQSRRGYDIDATGKIFVNNPFVPTEFARPFRSAGSAHLTVPTTFMGKDTSAYDQEISATQLRAIPDPADPGKTLNTTPLFQYTSVNPWDNSTRNAYFNYLGVERQANLTTTRSNVYSVWITVGYFEVTPATPKTWMTSLPGITQPQLKALMLQIYPDGCELGQELGSDTGEIVRHRGFYIIDRSIPVGFQRGQDLNVEKAILLKRIIE